MNTYSDDFPSQKKLFGIGAAWIVSITIFLLLLSAGLWGLSVLVAGPKGAGEAIKQKQSVTNRIQKQEQFEQLAADYEGYLVKIQLAKDAVNSAGNSIDKELRQTELVGLRQICVDTAQQFNAESRKYTSRDWKSAGLPPTLDALSCQ